MTSIMLHTPQRRAVTSPMTELNRATDERYAACLEQGGHVPSGRYIIRDWLAVPHSFMVCGRCDVPTRGGPA